MLNGISTRMLDLAARFPQLNFLIQKISMRKRRDTVIMSGVVALCIIFILLYTFH
jgi:Golgi SNAP receptor complex protein 1